MKPLYLIVFTGLLFACSQPRNTFPRSPYDSEVTRFASRLTGKKQKVKHLQGLENAFQQAQRFDLALIDSLLDENRPEHWPVVNTIYRRLKVRQEKVAVLQPLRAENGYEPALWLVSDVGNKEADSRRKAAAYLYDKAQKLLAEAAETGNRPAAREAFYTLQDLKQNYYHYWENANALFDSARILGVAHILLTNLPAPEPAAGQVFWREVSSQARRLNDEWHVYYPTFLANQPYDYVVQCQVKSINVGTESRSETTRTEEKDLEKGFEEKKDTAGRVIERKPIYEHVQAEVRQLSLSRKANGLLVVEVRNVHQNLLVVSKEISADYNYSEAFTYVSGDERALTFSVTTSATLLPSSPSASSMSDHLMGNMQSELFRFLKKNSAGL